MTDTTLLKVPQFSERHPAFSEGALRWLVFNSGKNGLDACGAVLRLGHKVVIDEQKFLAWVQAQSKQAAVA